MSPSAMIETITNLTVGFSVVIAIVLFVSYTFFLKSPNISKISILACGLFLSALTALQVNHLNFMNQTLTDSFDPLATLEYRLLLFIVPAMFYFFSRLTLFTEYKITIKSSTHLLPAVGVLFFETAIVVPAAFLIGTFYCLWLVKIIYGLRAHRKRFEIEFFFLTFFSLFAFIVLIFGFSVSYIDNAYFYYFYANGIALAYMLVTIALIIYPDLLTELTAAVKLGYVSSTLSKINVEEKIEQLKQQMNQSKIYENDNLSLSQLADALQLTGHQLSELINTKFNVSFSRYLRQIRVERAKILLKSEPNSSILSISMETGFKSQSNFYAAFKEITGQSPGSYRKY
ncbi:MAG: helix-turn-helix domain-containing protein [Kangiellaceae bacterium]|nr:helix-turn-helix domain-containing protein [Kangiellaceae bacterium]